MSLSKLCQPLRFQSVHNTYCRILTLFPEVLGPFWAHRLGFAARPGRYRVASLAEGPRKNPNGESGDDPASFPVT
jgi:hypothetical protein